METVITRDCAKCGETKPISKFDKQRNTCRRCRDSKSKKWSDHSQEYREKRQAQIKEYKRNNKEAVKLRLKKWRDKNRDKIRAKVRDYRKRPEVALRMKQQDKKLRPKRRAYRAAYMRNRRKTDELFHLECKIRSRINAAFYRSEYKKRGKTFDVLGCSAFELYIHLVLTAISRYGLFLECEQYHIDHIIPSSSANSEKELIQLNHYTNLQLLTPEENLKKSDKILTETNRSGDHCTLKE